jgi:glutathione synthase/RimK-type ligase-like ATP-grasp enzyme
MRPTIAIYFSDADPLGYPLQKKAYREAYGTLAEIVDAHGIDCRIVRGDSYRGKGVFAKSWILLPDQSVRESGPAHATLIFNRDDKNTIPIIRDCPIINHPDFDRLCTDKIATAEAFPALSPRTAAIHQWEECAQLLQQWKMHPSSLIVLKKNFETEGRGIHILPTGEVSPHLFDTWIDVLMQEFLDSSIGIPGIAEGVHDLRVTVVDGQPVNAFVRIPAPGSLLANVALGATGRSIDLDRVPQEIMNMVATIIAQTSTYAPVLFSADFLHAPQGYRLIELNSRPGMQHPDWSESYALFNDAVAHMLIKHTKRYATVRAK